MKKLQKIWLFREQILDINDLLVCYLNPRIQ